MVTGSQASVVWQDAQESLVAMCVLGLPIPLVAPWQLTQLVLVTV
jgi:hypothetical protein